ncbi:hypothetical protein HanPSC8_Chr12g0533271 [Helianthus annuus]|nr:hypothetical protein HanPSC8_Chr12g0533271 [Helianthus annuus]
MVSGFSICLGYSRICCCSHFHIQSVQIHEKKVYLFFYFPPCNIASFLLLVKLTLGQIVRQRLSDGRKVTCRLLGVILEENIPEELQVVIVNFFAYIKIQINRLI